MARACRSCSSTPAAGCRAAATLDAKVSRQVEAAVRDADVVLFVVDATVGVTEDDEPRRRRGCAGSSAPVLLVANKVDNDRRENDAWEFLALGLGDPYPVSALHGRRAGDLLDEVVALLPGGRRRAGRSTTTPNEPGRRRRCRHRCRHRRPAQRRQVARCSTGSIGDDRSVVHDMPGTTRDAIDTVVETDDGPIVFVDTAGMRRKAAIDDADRVLLAGPRAAGRSTTADVALLVIDATEGVTAPGPAPGRARRRRRLPDRRAAQQVGAARRRGTRSTCTAEVRAQAALPRRRAGAQDLGARPARACTSCCRCCSDAIDAATTAGCRPRRQPGDRRRPAARSRRRRRASVLYATQGATDPPTFTLFVNRELPPTYLRYLERSIREAFGFGATR